MKMYQFSLLILLSLLMLSVQACSRLSHPPTSTSTPQPSPTPTQTPLPSSTPTTTPPPGFGDLLREEAGGFTYLVPDGYRVSAGLGIVSMLAEGADPKIGPSISLIGTHPDPDRDAHALLDILEGSPGTTLSEPIPVKVGGFDGLSAEITILSNDVEIFGRIVTVVTPENQFIALAGSPQAEWESELELIFETILSSVTFFTPTAADPNAAPGEAATPVDGS
jgi:hypothetical protein